MRRLLAAAAAFSLCAAPAVAAEIFTGHGARDSMRELVRFTAKSGLEMLPFSEQPLQWYLPLALASAMMLCAAQLILMRRMSLRSRAPQLEAWRPAPVERPPETTIAVRIRNGRRFVKPAEIDAVRAADDYCELVLQSGERLLHASTLEALVRELPPPFRRIHRSAIINLERVASLRRRASRGYEMVTLAGEAVPIGRAYLREARRALQRRAAATASIPGSRPAR